MPLSKLSIPVHALARALCLLACLGPGPFAAAADLEIPIRIHVLRDLPFTVQGQPLPAWVSEADLRGPVMSELNAIWAPAGTRFRLQAVGPAVVDASQCGMPRTRGLRPAPVPEARRPRCPSPCRRR